MWTWKCKSTVWQSVVGGGKIVFILTNITSYHRKTKFSKVMTMLRFHIPWRHNSWPDVISNSMHGIYYRKRNKSYQLALWHTLKLFFWLTTGYAVACQLMVAVYISRRNSTIWQLTASVGVLNAASKIDDGITLENNVLTSFRTPLASFGRYLFLGLTRRLSVLNRLRVSDRCPRSFWNTKLIPPIFSLGLGRKQDKAEHRSLLR